MRLRADFTTETTKANDIFQKLKENYSNILEFLTYQKIAFKNKNKIDTF